MYVCMYLISDHFLQTLQNLCMILDLPPYFFPECLPRGPSEDESSAPDVMRSDGHDEDPKRNPNPSRLPSPSIVKEGSNDPTLETEVVVTSSSTYLPDDAPHEKVACEEEDLKKPKKLIPCPRCESMDTKFCYFNNYNVNQPRHFCKNCQRYWTAGGNLRNVPIGAGRRKSKPSIPLNQSENITVREDSLEDAKDLISCSGASSISQSTLFSRAHGAADSSSATTTILTFGQENLYWMMQENHMFRIDLMDFKDTSRISLAPPTQRLTTT